jgi:lipopolysaccharide transport system permease protein
MTDKNVIRRNADAREQGVGVLRLLRSVREHGSLVVELARREVTDLHAGQLGGFLWLVLHPVLMFAVYTFLFTVVLRVRIGTNDAEDYTIYLFAGLAPWLLTQDVLQRCSSVLLANVSIVKKVMFPVEAIVAKTLGASLIVQSVLMVLVLATTVWVRGRIPWTFALLPLLFMTHLALLWGLALLLSAITPYFRDVVELVRVFVTVNMFLMPVIYQPNMVPGLLRYIVVANPFSHLIWCYQDIIYFGSIEHPWSWLICALLAASALAIGSFVFVRLRHQFASVL